MMNIGKIIVPIDFSEYSKKSLRYAIEFARRFSSELVLVYVVEPVVYPTDFSFGAIAVPAVEEQLEENGRTQLARLIEEEVDGGIPSKAIVRSGKPFIEIIQTAKDEEGDLIIISTHGHSGFEHVLFGSTAEKVVRKAPCPVLSIRSPEREFVMP